MKTEKTEQGRREDYLAWRAVVAIICGGWWWQRRCRRLRFSLVLPLFSLSLCFLFFFFCSSSFSFSFFFSFGLPNLLCSPLSCLDLLSLVFSRPLFFLPPCFYRQKIGERDRGGATCCRPSTALPTRGKFLGIFLMFFRGRTRWKQGEEKIFFFPCFVRLGEKQDSQCHSKRYCFGPYFFFSWTVHETTPFWTKHIVSFKRKRWQKRVKVHFGPQFVICSIKSSVAILI